MTQILTRLVGSGHFPDGNLIARPLNPWVIWDGEATRPIAKRFKIVNQALYELDGVTGAQLPPSYIPSGFVPSGTLLPVQIYPDNNCYFVEVLQRGSTVLKGYWQIPYDPGDDGFEWYNIDLESSSPIYHTPRQEDDSVKSYASSGVMWTDFYNVIEGTIVYTEDTGTYWGRTETEFVPFWAMTSSLLTYLIRDYSFPLTTTEQNWEEVIEGFDGIVGSTTGPDTNDALLTFSTKRYTFGADDYIHVLTVPFQYMTNSGTLLRDFNPLYGIDGEYLIDNAGGQDATLGSTTGSDTNDPTWNSSESSLTFGADDYAYAGELPWV